VNDASKPLKLLVAAAWEPELVRFRQRLAVAPTRIDVALATLGVGLVEASIAMTRCVAQEKPTAALLIGTCGAFGAAHPVGSVVSAARVRLVDGSVVDGTAALPGPMPAEAVFDAGLQDALVAAGARSVQIANTVGITTDDALAARLARAGARDGDRDAGGDVLDVEHLEAFAFARACAVAGVPCAAALGIANVVGSKGRAEWLAGHERASDAAADVAWRALEAIITSIAQRVRA
jgi:nucleoside phosphorylase